MKIQLKQQCEIGGVFLPVKHRGRPQDHEVSINLLSDSYFASLLNNDSLKVISLTEDELEAFGEEKFKALPASLQKHLMEVFERLEREEKAKSGPVKSFTFTPPKKTDEELALEAEELRLKEERDKKSADDLLTGYAEAAKLELAELSQKKNLSNKDKKRIEELNKIKGE